jgi:hypothetical protein
VNLELVTSGTLRTVARSTLSLQYSSGTGDIRYLEDRCKTYIVTAIFTNVQNVTSSLFLLFVSGLFLCPIFTLHIPLEVQYCFLIICYLHYFTVAVFSCLFFFLASIG